MPDWAQAVLAVLTGTVPMAGLLLGLHDRNVRARRRDARQHRKRERRLNVRLDHLDACVDSSKSGVVEVRERVIRLENSLSNHLQISRPDDRPLQAAE